jgi:hypothetical protein
VTVSADIGGEPEAVVGFAEAGIIRAAQKLVERGAVTIGGPEVTQ